MLASENTLDHIPQGIQALLSITINPKKQALNNLEAEARKFNEWAENIHLQPWKDVQASLIKMEFVFNLFEALILKIDETKTPGQLAVQRYYTALKNLLVAMEDHVLNGTIDGQYEGGCEPHEYAEDGPYNPEFVKMIEKAAASKKRIKINPANIWESLK